MKFIGFILITLFIGYVVYLKVDTKRKKMQALQKRAEEIERAEEQAKRKEKAIFDYNTYLVKYQEAIQNGADDRKLNQMDSWLTVLQKKIDEI